jgi:hypothetical protein
MPEAESALGLEAPGRGPAAINRYFLKERSGLRERRARAFRKPFEADSQRRLAGDLLSWLRDYPGTLSEPQEVAHEARYID